MVHFKVHPPQQAQPFEIQFRPKEHKLDNFILVGERNSILQRKGVVVPVYCFFYDNFPDVEYFSARLYIHLL